MVRMAKIFCVCFLAVSLLLPVPHASAKAKDVVSDIMKIAGAGLLIKALTPILGPILGLAPAKTKEQKEQEKKEKKEKKGRQGDGKGRQGGHEAGESGECH